MSAIVKTGSYESKYPEQISSSLTAFAPSEQSTKSVADAWTVVASFGTFKEKVRLAQVNRQINHAVSEDPAYLIVTAMKLIANGQIRTAQELITMFNRLSYINFPRPGNPNFLIQTRKLKGEIVSKYRGMFVNNYVSARADRELIEFFDQNYQSLDARSKRFADEFIIGNLIDYLSNKNLYYLYHIQKYSFHKWFIGLPEQESLNLALIRLDLANGGGYKAIPPIEREKVEAQMAALKILIGQVDENESGMTFLEIDISDYRFEIFQYLYDPVFMGALFFLNRFAKTFRIFDHGLPLIDQLYEHLPSIKDPNVVEAIFRYEPKVLRYADPKLLENREFLFRLFSLYEGGPEILENASQDLLNDQEFISSLVAIEGALLEKVPEAHKDNPEIVLKAVKQAGHALEFASEKCKENREIVLAAVNEIPLSLKFASQTFWADREIIISAFTNFLRDDPSFQYGFKEITIDEFYESIDSNLKTDPIVQSLYERTRLFYLLTSTAKVLKQPVQVFNPEKAAEIMKEALKLIYSQNRQL